MQQSLRFALRATRVTTAAGLAVGWLHDVELELDMGQLVRISVIVSRWWSFHPVWIPRERILSWEPGHITVKDAWALIVQNDLVSAPLPATAPSYYADRS